MSPVVDLATVSRGHARCVCLSVCLVQTLRSVLPCLLWPCPAAHRARRMQSKDAFHRVQWWPVTQWRPRGTTDRQTIMPEQKPLWILNQHKKNSTKSLYEICSVPAFVRWLLGCSRISRNNAGDGIQRVIDSQRRGLCRHYSNSCRRRWRTTNILQKRMHDVR
jgi:hypothetical protein